MSRWNNTDVPLAYLITFRCYGTWLHGDERQSIDRAHNIYGTPRVPSNVIREQQQFRKLKSEPFVMDARARATVEDAMRQVCAYRGWRLYALNVRTNHAHAVVSAHASANKVLGDLKGYATRRLREAGCWPHQHSPWVDKGSKRNLWTEDQIARASDYVAFGQGDDLPSFD